MQELRLTVSNFIKSAAKEEAAEGHRIPKEIQKELIKKAGSSVRKEMGTGKIPPWLSDGELAGLNETVSRGQGSLERFIRQCISGAAIKEASSVDMPKLTYISPSSSATSASVI